MPPVVLFAIGEIQLTEKTHWQVSFDKYLLFITIATSQGVTVEHLSASVALKCVFVP